MALTEKNLNASLVNTTKIASYTFLFQCKDISQSSWYQYVVHHNSLIQLKTSKIQHKTPLCYVNQFILSQLLPIYYSCLVKAGQIGSMKQAAGRLDNSIRVISMCSEGYNPIYMVMYMMMSRHGNCFCITGPLWGESTCHWWFPHKGPAM